MVKKQGWMRSKTQLRLALGELMADKNRTLGYTKAQQAWSWSSCLPLQRLQDSVRVPVGGRQLYYLYVVKCSKAHLKFNQRRCNFKIFSSKCNWIHTKGSMYLVHCIIHFMKCLASLLKQQSHCQWLLSTGLHQFGFSNVTFP